MARKVFHNIPNKEITVMGKSIWLDRSIATASVILAITEDTKNIYVLASKRGDATPDYQGLWNMCCGYLDWNESGPQGAMREIYEECGLDVEDILLNGNILVSDFDQPWSVASEPTQNKQNVTLRYGLCFIVPTEADLPPLTTEFNEVVGEAIDPTWLPADQINNREWAFNHDVVANKYIQENAPLFQLI